MKTKKELKEQYKQMKTPMGVFQIRNVTNNKVLIDNSTDITSRWNRHRMQLKTGTHPNKVLQKDWEEQGEGNFVLEILSELERGDEENVDYRKELATLQAMIIEELGADDGSIYK